jgi:hypothetical protein
MWGESAGRWSSLRDLSLRHNPRKYNELFGITQRFAGLHLIVVIAPKK